MDDNKAQIYAIETNNLTKIYKSREIGFEAVSNVSLKVFPGDIFALIGPNGAGKTTLIKMLVGLIKNDKGHFSIFGHNLSKEPEETKNNFGYIPDNPTVYEYLSGMEFLYFTGTLRGLSQDKIKARITELMKIFPLKEIIHQPMAEYSRGNRQKLAFLAAIISKPKLLIIDEPIVGLDPSSINILGKQLKKYIEEGGTVFFVTHILSFAQDYATRVALMNKGKLIKEERIREGETLDKLYDLASVK